MFTTFHEILYRTQILYWRFPQTFVASWALSFHGYYLQYYTIKRQFRSLGFETLVGTRLHFPSLKNLKLLQNWFATNAFLDHARCRRIWPLFHTPLQNLWCWYTKLFKMLYNTPIIGICLRWVDPTPRQTMYFSYPRNRNLLCKETLPSLCTLCYNNDTSDQSGQVIRSFISMNGSSLSYWESNQGGEPKVAIHIR